MPSKSAAKKKGVLIDILRFSPAVYGAKSNEVQFRPARYVAWLTPPAGAGECRSSTSACGAIEAACKTTKPHQALSKCDKTKNP